MPAAERDDALQDFVDALLASWAESRPDLDVRPVAVTTRLARARDHLEAEMGALVGSFGESTPSFVMLATLVRLSAPGEAVGEHRIAEELGLTAGTIAMRIDRLVERDVVRRDEDGAVRFTAHGRRHAEAVVQAHVANQARLLSALTDDEQATLAALLRRLLLSFEGPLDTPG